MQIEESAQNEVVIACNANVIPVEVRERWVEAGKRVYQAVQEIRDLPTGYGFRLPPDSSLLLTVAEYIANERLCCPFLCFTVEVEPNGGPFWLRLSGGQGVKEYIWSVFMTTDLLNKQAIEATGLS